MKKYTSAQVFLHWLSALIIIWAMSSGFYLFLGNVSPTVKSGIAFINVSLTTLFIPFFVLRVFYALRRGKPEIERQRKKQHLIAHIVHCIIYINTALVLFTGVMMMEREINIFNLLTFPAPLDAGALTFAFYQLHIILCLTLSALIVMHILAVFYHLLSGNNILKRMSW